jgi:hypothetical protein
LDERDFVEVEALPRQDLPNLLARILIKTPSLVNQSARTKLVGPAPTIRTSLRVISSSAIAEACV